MSYSVKKSLRFFLRLLLSQYGFTDDEKKLIFSSLDENTMKCIDYALSWECSSIGFYPCMECQIRWLFVLVKYCMVSSLDDVTYGKVEAYLRTLLHEYTDKPELVTPRSLSYASYIEEICDLYYCLRLCG